MYKLRLSQKKVHYNIISVVQKISRSNFVVTSKIKYCTTLYEGNVEFQNFRTQKILWRNESEDPIGKYCLKTMTNGKKLTSILTTACLQKLANKNKQYKTTSQAINTDFYMDDYFGRANSITESTRLRDKIISYYAVL